jgi:hypothetical protein
MPLGITDENDVQVNEDYPNLPVDEDTDALLKEEISHRITVCKEIETLIGVKKMIDGTIHEIVNNHLYENETADSFKKGYTLEGEDNEEVQIQIRNAYRAKKCAIKQKKGQEPKETNKDIIALAEIFELKKNKDGTFPFPAGTFLYKDTIVVDPTKVHPDMFEDFVKDVRALGVKYKQGRMNPVSEHTELIASPTFHLGRLKLPKKINIKLHEIFQNIAVKLLNEEEEKSA